jgi:hypothetical protein
MIAATPSRIRDVRERVDLGRSTPDVRMTSLHILRPSTCDLFCGYLIHPVGSLMPTNLWVCTSRNPRLGRNLADVLRHCGARLHYE